MTTQAPWATAATADQPWLFTRDGSRAGQPWRGHDGRPRTDARPAAVLFDRDGTLVEDVPYNGDPGLVRPDPHARAALDAVRARGVPVGVVTNQSGVARGLLSWRDVEAVRLRIEELLGPFDVWAVCPHGGDGCACRKPAPGLVHAACSTLGVDPHRAAVIGDIGSDVAAALAAGARAELVPTPVTRPEEIAEAARTAQVAPDLVAAVAALFGDGRTGPGGVR